MSVQLPLTSGLAVLEDWSADVSQGERNQVYEALFAIVDGSAVARYDLHSENGEFRLVVPNGRVVVGRFDQDSFEVHSITDASPGDPCPNRSDDSEAA